MSWERICQPKKDGGLGLRTMRDLNLNFMMKASWNFCSPSPSLWKEVLKGNNHTGRGRFPQIDKKRTGSNFWQEIKTNWEVFRENLCGNLVTAKLLGYGKTIGSPMMLH